MLQLKTDFVIIVYKKQIKEKADPQTRPQRKMKKWKIAYQRIRPRNGRGLRRRVAAAVTDTAATPKTSIPSKNFFIRPPFVWLATMACQSFNSKTHFVLICQKVSMVCPWIFAFVQGQTLDEAYLQKSPGQWYD